MLKRLMSVLLAAALIFAAFGVITASAEDAEELADTAADAEELAETGGMPDWVKSSFVCGDYKCYEDLDGNAAIYSYTGSDEEVVIPSELNGHPVVGLYWGCFQNKDMTSVSIPETVEIIESDVFDGCKKLETVNIPNSVYKIGDRAFRNCELLNLDMPASLKEVGSEAFDGTLWLTLQPNGVVYAGTIAYTYKGTVPATVTVKNGTTAISPKLFEDNDDLKTVILPASLKSIGYDAFKSCGNLEDINLPPSLESIGTSAFEDCDALTTITLPASLNELGDRVFHYCDNLVTLTVDPANPVFDSRDNCNAIIRKSDNKLLMAIKTGTVPSGVEIIGRDAFMSNQELVDLVLPDSVRVIEGQAFWGCSNIETVRFPAQLESVGDRAFAYCYNLADIQLPDTVKHLSRNSFERTQWENDLPAGIIYFGDVVFGCKYNEDDERPVDLVIREGTKYIADDAFNNQWSIQTVSLPGSLIEIGSSAFRDCDGITTVSIPEGVTIIGNSAFDSCDELTTVSVPSTATDLGWDIFSNDVSLKYVTLAEGFTVISDWMFNHCSALESIDLPESLTVIGQSAFQDCTSLTAFTIPDGVTTIKSYAFSNCTGITNIRLGAGLTDVNDTAFSKCEFTYVFVKDMDTFWVAKTSSSGFCLKHLMLNNKVVRDIALPDNWISIPEKCFKDWDDLKTVTLNEGLESIGSEAFAYCDGLTEITIPANVRIIGVDAFTDCKSLTKLKVDKNNKTYDSRGNCNAIINTPTNILYIGCAGSYIPDTVTEIHSHAFENCTALTEIRIPSSVKTIGNRAFTGSGLTKIVLPESVTNIDGAFRECDKLKDIAIGNSRLSLNNSELGIYEYWEYEIINNVVHIYKAVKKYDGIVIYGFEDSTAQTYARSNGFTFKSWSERPDEPPEVIPAILGDADGSGEVDAADATVVQRAVTLISVPYEVDQLMCADIDGDGDLTIVDATFIQRYSTRVAIPYAIGEAI